MSFIYKASLNSASEEREGDDSKIAEFTRGEFWLEFIMQKTQKEQQQQQQQKDNKQTHICHV